MRLKVNAGENIRFWVEAVRLLFNNALLRPKSLIHRVELAVKNKAVPTSVGTAFFLNVPTQRQFARQLRLVAPQ
ncbi:hypothetical protein M0D69_35150 [Caballeronia sp. SEWSISQ10-4 2]|uniref:hypothetical protein n=1 Tax=Caballeronia sp. SEWSISQ10-4 2 TaxID=2937438 RepID=UPI002655448D|nr:hypothetical protein [Caballeronia sp. SEWSISQ10-4 2]MDN7183160.1 hypothetical protein [Caballeronia sp. SEWSISQ10-4 2]